MGSLTSKDGTHITYDRIGEGPSLILVSGALADRQASLPVAEALKGDFTVLIYDRRGRGDSGDSSAYDVKREIEDLDTLIGAAGGSAFVFGFSSGAALSLEAAASGLAIRKLGLWEAPFILEGSRPLPPADNAKTLTDLVSTGRRGDAVEFFLTEIVGMPREVVAEMRSQPSWTAQEDMAHTLVYETTILGDYSLPAGRTGRVNIPTLVMAGGADIPWIRESAKALARLIPNAKTHFLDDQEHQVDPAVLAPVLVEFFTS